jgi:hypothetical protein
MIMMPLDMCGLIDETKEEALREAEADVRAASEEAAG